MIFYDNFSGQTFRAEDQTVEEAKEKLKKLNERHSEILELDIKEFLSDPITNELRDIHRQCLELAKFILANEKAE